MSYKANKDNRKKKTKLCIEKSLEFRDFFISSF